MQKFKSDIFFNYLFPLFFCMTYFRFFRPVGIADEVWKVLLYAAIIFILWDAKEIYLLLQKRDFFSKAVMSFFCMILLTTVTAQIYWDQSWIDTLLSSAPYFSFAFYFYLTKHKPDARKIEQIIWTFVIIYIACFYASLVLYPTRIFMGFGEVDRDIDTSRGLARIRLTLIGAGPLYLAYFLSINKLKIKFNVKWLFIILLLFVTILLQLGRQSIVFSLALGLLFYFSGASWKTKIYASLFIAFISYIALNDNPVVQALIETSQSDYDNQLSGDENIRLQSYKFYMTNVSKSLITDILGNGQYSLGKSKYGDFIDHYGRRNGYIPADVGYAGIFLYFGALGLIFFTVLLISILFKKIDKRYSYAKYYLVFLYLGSVAGNTLLGSIPTFCIALYILQLGTLQLVQNKNGQRKKDYKSIAYSS